MSQLYHGHRSWSVGLPLPVRELGGILRSPLVTMKSGWTTTVARITVSAIMGAVSGRERRQDRFWRFVRTAADPLRRARSLLHGVTLGSGMTPEPDRRQKKQKGPAREGRPLEGAWVVA